MVDRRIEFLDVNLETITCVVSIFHGLFYLTVSPAYATPLNAAERIIGEHGIPYGFQYVHDGMVHDPVREIGQPVNHPFLRLVNREHLISGCPESPIQQGVMQ